MPTFWRWHRKICILELVLSYSRWNLMAQKKSTVFALWNKFQVHFSQKNVSADKNGCIRVFISDYPIKRIKMHFSHFISYFKQIFPRCTKFSRRIRITWIRNPFMQVQKKYSRFRDLLQCSYFLWTTLANDCDVSKVIYEWEYSTFIEQTHRNTLR